MTTTETTENTQTGRVAVYAARGEVKKKLLDTHNFTCAASANALAAAYAGDTSLVPKAVVFIYSSSDTDRPTVNKETTWESIEEFPHVETPFSYRASVDTNKVTFHARTQGIPADKFIHAACLVGKSQTGNEYEVLAVVDLGGKKKQEDFELSLDWTITFNERSSSDDGDEDPLES